MQKEYKSLGAFGDHHSQETQLHTNSLNSDRMSYYYGNYYGGLGHGLGGFGSLGYGSNYGLGGFGGYGYGHFHPSYYGGYGSFGFY